eukprot:1798279-Lingulodinium_polyedra.AAC.1
MQTASHCVRMETPLQTGLAGFATRPSGTGSAKRSRRVAERPLRCNRLPGGKTCPPPPPSRRPARAPPRATG